MQEKSVQAENELWNAVGEALDTEMSTIEDVLESLARTQKGNVKSSVENCMTILYRDPVLKDAICKNELTDKIDIVKPLLWKRCGNSVTDVDMYQIQRYIETNYGISSDKEISKAVSIAASEKSYHPIRKFLESLQWDGKSRIADLLPRFLGADDNEYTREIMRLLMLAAVHRIYEPGCKFEILVCLVGGQGAGKSTFFRFLAVNDDWFTDDLKRMDDENVYSKMQGHWIIEMSEMLATVNAKSIEDIKSFLSRQKETYRIPYQTYAEDRPRQCIFVGTSNNLDFLPLDRTGNRRFAPVLVYQERVEKHILADEKESRKYIVQAWAEANQRRTWEYLQGVTRKDGSYGKILSDAFVVVADGEKSLGTDKAGNDFTDLKEDAADVFQEMLGRMLEQKFQEMLQNFQEFFEEQISRGIRKYDPDIHSGVDVPSETDGMGQMRESDLSEDMMAFAFAMGE